MATKTASALLAVACVSVIGLSEPSMAQAAEITHSFNIPAGSLKSGLQYYTRQTGIQLIYRSDDIARARTHGVSGAMASDAALQILLRDTGFDLRRDASGALALQRRRTVGAPKAALVQPAAAVSETPSASHPEEVAEYEDIVVTARRREETLQSVPVAVSVVGAEQLSKNLANDLTKLAELVPQVAIGQGGAGTGSVITMRGISSASSDSGLDQSVAVEVDGVPLSRGSIISASLYDVGSIQVLQGPQALYFGKNSPAGVISIRSAAPTRDFQAYLTAGYEFKARERYLEGAVSGPLSSNLAARIAFRVRGMDGWIKNVATPMADVVDPSVTVPGANWGRLGPKGDDYAGRLSLRWEPSDTFEANARIELKRQTQSSSNANTEPFCINGQTVPVRSGVPIPGADCERDMVKSHGGVAPIYAEGIPFANGGVPYARNRYLLASLELRKKFGNFTVESTTGFFDQDVSQMQVSDWTPYAAWWSASSESYRLVTQEFRVSSNFDGPINFMLGGYFEDFNRPYSNVTDLGHVYNPVAGNYATQIKEAYTSGDYLSAFGQLSWNITPQLELSGGARYSRDRKSISMANVATGPGSPTLYPLGVALRSTYRDEHVSPEATLNWKPTPEHTLYVAYKTGYKAGGLSTPLLLTTASTPENIAFGAEKAGGFEIGYKASLFDRRLRFDITGYRFKYKDLQVSSYNAETTTFVLQNAASARVQGIQFQGEFRATDELTLRGNIGYNDAKYLTFNTAQCYTGQTAAQGCVNRMQNLSGRPLPRAPKVTFALGADYEPRLFEGWDTNFSIQASHSGSYIASSDYGPGGYQAPYWLLNAAVRVGPSDERVQFALIGRNLTNSYYMLQTIGWSGTGNSNQYVGFFNRPREVVFQTTVQF